MISLEVITEEEISLTEVLIKIFPDLSKNKLKKVYNQKRVMRNSFLIEKDTLLKKGEKISILKKPNFLRDLVIYYEDKELIVVEKPAFLLSVDSDKDPGNSVHAQLKRRYGAVYPVHRLDRETTGVMVFAFNREMKEALGKLFEQKIIEREYVAIAHGVVPQESGTWKAKLYEGIDKKMRVDSRGKDSTTHYKVLTKSKGHTFLRCTLSTGRKNQIRAHASHFGYPIVGDTRYGTARKNQPLYLHAQILAFTHPKTSKKLKFTSPIPQGFRKKLF
jgi:23S rRNA pseudouridine1911/1915/1917 synthase